MSANYNKIWDEYGEGMRNSANSADIEALRIKFLGKKGIVTELLKELKQMSPEQRRESGAKINELKCRIQQSLESALGEIAQKEQESRLNSARPDPTMPGTLPEPGSMHPVSRVAGDIAEIFLSMGFFMAEGPEIEEEYYNFEALNVPKHHPARDMQDTFFLENGKVLRTQTSPMQIRTMEKMKPPLKMIALGKVFRRDSDVTHSPMFTQMEGLVVGENVSMSDLKGTMVMFADKMFGKRLHRFRPSYFPFTEPSAEMDIHCIFCEGKGCRVCKSTGWLEVLGCGMVNPKVFEAVDYDTEKYSGFAFGIGIERMAMLLYAIDHIQLFYQSDIRFLRQF